MLPALRAAARRLRGARGRHRGHDLGGPQGEADEDLGRPDRLGDVTPVPVGQPRTLPRRLLHGGERVQEGVRRLFWLTSTSAMGHGAEAHQSPIPCHGRIPTLSPPPCWRSSEGDAVLRLPARICWNAYACRRCGTHSDVRVIDSGLALRPCSYSMRPAGGARHRRYEAFGHDVSDAGDLFGHDGGRASVLSTHADLACDLHTSERSVSP